MLNPQEAHFAAATAIGVLIGALYALPVAAHFGDPLANVASYHSQQWQGGWLFGFPFYAIVKGTWLYPAPWTNLALSFSWILLVLGAVVMMIKSPEFRAYCRLHLVEAAFLVPYLWCLFTYNCPHWARQLSPLRNSNPSICSARIPSLDPRGPTRPLGYRNRVFCARCLLGAGNRQRCADAAKGVQLMPSRSVLYGPIYG